MQRDQIYLWELKIISQGSAVGKWHIFQHEKINFLSQSNHAIFLLWYKMFKVNNKWRVRWKKDVRYFTQNRTLSKTLQISHAVLFRCLKHCSACFFPEACFLFEILRMRKNAFFRGHPLGTFCWMKNKRTFCFAKRWSHYNTLIIYYCFVSASG